jgi:hypothetical protein
MEETMMKLHDLLLSRSDAETIAALHDAHRRGARRSDVRRSRRPGLDRQLRRVDSGVRPTLTQINTRVSPRHMMVR